MYSQHPEIAKRWEKEGKNYIAGKGGGFIDSLKNLIFGNKQGQVKGASTGAPNPTPTETDQQWRKRRMDYIKKGNRLSLNVTPEEQAAMPKVPVQTTEFERRTIPTFDKYQVPREVAYGIANAEGGNIGNNNIYNINATDSNPTGAFNYDSPEAAATAAAKLLSGKYELGHIGSGKFDTRYKAAWDKRASPSAMLDEIVKAGYAGDPATWKQRSAETGGAGLYYNGYADFVKNLAGWKKWAGNY